VLDCLGRLVDKSLVQVEPGGPRSRYRLLETIRQLARERLGAAGEIHALDAAHCRHFLELAAAQDPERATGVVVERPQQLDAEHDNLRAALGWALGNDHDRALLLGVSLWRYWLARGHFVEGTDWLERILQLPVPPSRNRARAVLGLALLDTRRGRGERLKELADTFVTVNEQYGDRADVVYARLVRGILLLSGPDLDEVESTATSVLVEAELLGAAPVASVARSLAAMAALFREDLAVARRRFAECLTQLATVDPASPPFFPVATLSMPLIPVQGRVVPVFEESWLPGRRVGALQARGYTLSALADAHRLAGDLDGALDAVHDSADAFGAIHDPAGTAHALNHLGCVERDRGLFEPADGHLREALRIRRELGDRRGESLALANLGLLSAAAGELVDGRRLAALALERARDVEDGPGSAGALLNLAVVELYAGEPHAARPLVEQAVEAFRPQRYVRLEAWARLLAAELARAGDKPAAIRNGRAAAELFARIDCRIGTARARELLEDLGALEGVGEGGAKAR
jgi:tetratricopeptide (TPR) repeat protein